MRGNPRLHPDHHLALWLQRAFILRHQPMCPGASRQHQALRLIRPARGPHHDAVSPAFPALQRFTAMDVGPVAESGIDVGHKTTLRGEQATLGLIEAQEGSLQAIAWKASAERLGLQHLVHQMMQLRRFERSAEHRTVGSADIERARHDQQPLLDLAFERPPQLIGAVQQRDIGRMLKVGQTNDAREAVR